jgi:hypothetical protein
MTGLRYAFARLSRQGDVWLWVVARCPVCGQRHVHGGGTIAGDPRELLGHRVAHCGLNVESNGYVLTDDPGLHGKTVIA